MIAYLAEADPLACQRLVDRIRRAREQLAEFPNSGPPGGVPGTRRVVVGAYVLTIRVRKGETEILAFRHAKQGDAYAPRETAEEEG